MGSASNDTHTHTHTHTQRLASPVLTTLHKLMALENDGHAVLRNTGTHSPNDTVPQHKTLESTATQP